MIRYEYAEEAGVPIHIGNKQAHQTRCGKKLIHVWWVPIGIWKEANCEKCRKGVEKALARRAECRRLKRAILKIIGKKCVDCGSSRLIEPDHKHGCMWDQRQFNRRDRLRRMLKEAEQGLLVARCQRHNRARNQSVLGLRADRGAAALAYERKRRAA